MSKASFAALVAARKAKLALQTASEEVSLSSSPAIEPAVKVSAPPSPPVSVHNDAVDMHPVSAEAITNPPSAAPAAETSIDVIQVPDVQCGPSAPDAAIQLSDQQLSIVSDLQSKLAAHAQSVSEMEERLRIESEQLKQYEQALQTRMQESTKLELELQEKDVLIASLNSKHQKDLDILELQLAESLIVQDALHSGLREKDADLESYKAQLEAVPRETAHTQLESTSTGDDLKDLTAKLAESEARFESAKAEHLNALDAKQSILDMLQLQIDSKDKEMEEHKQSTFKQLEICGDRIRELELKLEESNDRVTKVQASCEAKELAMQKNIENLTAQLEKTENDSKNKSDSNAKEIQSLKARLAEVENENTELKAAIAEKDRSFELKLSTHADEKSKTEQLLIEKEQQWKDARDLLDRQVLESREQLENLEEKLTEANLRIVKNQNAFMVQLEAQESELKADAEKQQAIIDSLRSDCDSFSDQVAELNQKLEDTATELLQLKQTASKAEDDHLDRIATLERNLNEANMRILKNQSAFKQQLETEQSNLRKEMEAEVSKLRDEARDAETLHRTELQKQVGEREASLAEIRNLMQPVIAWMSRDPSKK
ncbi:hypothetical protein HDU78_009883 [Chytriomyces hyalinus]|nr:hypothetical protein HDU78_009883 [Chytriomyces hyalinus]